MASVWGMGSYFQLILEVSRVTVQNSEAASAAEHRAFQDANACRGGHAAPVVMVHAGGLLRQLRAGTGARGGGHRHAAPLAACAHRGLRQDGLELHLHGDVPLSS